MIKFTAFVVLVAIRIMYQPSQAQNAAFADPSVISQPPAKLIGFEGTRDNNKVSLQWKVEENESINLFEIEKSGNGKDFKTAALVFGTDSKENNSYLFHEKNKQKDISYRIKMINKDNHIEYSSIVVIRKA
jgi:hypothetical protein